MNTLPSIVLAAGLSSRMEGAFKPLLPLNNKPLLLHVLDSLHASHAISKIFVVTGHRAADIAASSTLFPPNTHLIHNPDFAKGEMRSSLQTGLKALFAASLDPSRDRQGATHVESQTARPLPDGRCSDSAHPPAPAFLLAFADQPAVRPGTIDSLVRAFCETTPPLVLPTFAGKRGHPVIFSALLVPSILALAGDDTLRSVVHHHLVHARLVPVEDPSVLEDLDTPEDFERAARNYCNPPATST